MESENLEIFDISLALNHLVMKQKFYCLGLRLGPEPVILRKYMVFQRLDCYELLVAAFRLQKDLVFCDHVDMVLNDFLQLSKSHGGLTVLNRVKLKGVLYVMQIHGVRRLRLVRFHLRD